MKKYNTDDNTEGPSFVVFVGMQRSMQSSGQPHTRSASIIHTYKDSLDTRAETDFIVSVHSRLTNCQGEDVHG